MKGGGIISGLEIHDRMFNLLDRMYPALINFPKSERYALTQDIKNSLEKAEQMLNSFKGHAEHADSYNFIKSLLDRFDFLYLVTKPNGKTLLKINVDKLVKAGGNIDILQK